MARRSRRRLPKEPISLKIDNLSHDGRGVATHNGKKVFVALALAGEEVSAILTKRTTNFDEAVALDIIDPSPKRIEPKCKHFEMCGGCNLQHMRHEEQVLYKQATLIELLKNFGKVEPLEILAPMYLENSYNYRTKARLSVKHVKKHNKTLIGFRERKSPDFVTDIDSCVILHPLIGNNIGALKEIVNSLEDPASIAQVEIAVGDNGVVLIFRNLEKLSVLDEDNLKEFAKEHNFNIYLQPGNYDTVYPLCTLETFDGLYFEHIAHDARLKFHPLDFTQVNPLINNKMVSFAIDILQIDKSDKVLDLFCGIGNFSIPIAKYASDVVGIELDDAMVKKADINAEFNSIKNTKFIAADLFKEENIKSLGSLNCNKLVIDPPRTGAYELVQNMDFANVEKALYISCNPATLARDANILTEKHGFVLQKAGIIDMFSHTKHTESVALFVKEGING